jgi:hypothetical protein
MHPDSADPFPCVALVVVRDLHDVSGLILPFPAKNQHRIRYDPELLRHKP